MDFETLNKQIISCRKCSRLSCYIKEVSQKKVKRFSHWNYWGKPVPGFGDANAQVLIIGLAPAKDGANRTGRMFTGDSSGDWLFRALHATGFAGQPNSISADDGMQLNGVYISAIVRCAPPDNKPLKSEIETCVPYLSEELRLLNHIKVVLTLGHLAFNTFTSVKRYKGLKFGHNKFFKEDERIIISSYHPSRQNTQTGRLVWNDWINVFRNIKNFL